MSVVDEDEEAINGAVQAWRQGDISLDAGLEFLHLADLSRPHSPASKLAAEASADEGDPIEVGPVPVVAEVRGVVVLTQTCDVIRDCRSRPFIEVAPLVERSSEVVEAIRRLKRPAFAYVPAVAEAGLVADLERVMTVEKSLVATWTRVPGWQTDEEVRSFALALARKRQRFAFPDDFVQAAGDLQKHLAAKHDKKTEEGAHLGALREIRLRAAPSWNSEKIQLTWWFIKESEPSGFESDWPNFLDQWLAKFDQTGRFSCDPPIACRLEDMTARDYLESDHLDLDRLSVSRRA